MVVGLGHYLVLGVLLFATGLFIALAKRNPIAVLIGIEMMLQACNINLVAFNRFSNPAEAGGYVFMMIVMVVAAAEVAVGIALIMKQYRERGGTDLADINWLKW